MSRPGLLISDYIADGFGTRLREAMPDYEQVVMRPEGVSGDLSCVEVVFFSSDLYPERAEEFLAAFQQAKKMRWFHSFSAGTDEDFFTQMIRQGIHVTTSSGANAPAIVNLAVLFLIGLARKLPARMQAQRDRRWDRFPVDDLDGATLVILGLGPIGRGVASVADALGMHVIGLRRTPSGDEPCETWPMERLAEALERANYLVAALPILPETHHLLDADAFARMPPGAYVVNVGRGSVIDEPALIEALRSGHLGGAGLDVFETEPLPESSPLWELPNVMITSHDSDSSEESGRRAIEIFIDNLKRWGKGEPLLNEVTRD